MAEVRTEGQRDADGGRGRGQPRDRQPAGPGSASPTTMATGTACEDSRGAQQQQPRGEYGVVSTSSWAGRRRRRTTTATPAVERAGRSTGTAPGRARRDLRWRAAAKQRGADERRAARPPACAGTAASSRAVSSETPSRSEQPLDQRRARGLRRSRAPATRRRRAGRAAKSRSTAARHRAQVIRWVSTEAPRRVDGAVHERGERLTRRSARVVKSGRSCQLLSQLRAGAHQPGLDRALGDVQQRGSFPGGQPVEHGHLQDDPQLGGDAVAAPARGRRTRR